MQEDVNIVAENPSAGRFVARLVEFVVLFAGVPLLLDRVQLKGALFPVLLVGLAVCVALLRADRTFDRSRFGWGPEKAKATLRPVFVLFAIAAVIGTIAVAAVYPERFLAFPQQKLAVWVMVMILYPLLSVYPQEVIYRAFLMHRYKAVFPGRWTMIVASAAAFGFGHILFHHAITVILTFVGGFLFAYTYDRTKSTLHASVEHALYGCFIFTVGMGEFFYLGAAR